MQPPAETLPMNANCLTDHQRNPQIFCEKGPKYTNEIGKCFISIILRYIPKGIHF